MLKELDVKAPEDTNGHIIAQKKLYLLKACGLNLGGYAFAWDLYGPFSAGLADDLRDYRRNQELYSAIGEKVALTPMAQKALADTMALTARPEEDPTVDQTRWLEILSSLHFIADTYYRTDHNFQENLVKKDAQAIELLTGALIDKKAHLEPYKHLVAPAWRRIRPLIACQPKAAA
jgi:hypothetical protein